MIGWGSIKYFGHTALPCSEDVHDNWCADFNKLLSSQYPQCAATCWVFWVRIPCILWPYQHVCVWATICVSQTSHLSSLNDFSPPSPPLVHLSSPSQTVVLTFVTGTASAPWASRVGTVSVRPAGGAPAAAWPWRRLVLTTRTMKEVNMEL